MECKEESHPNMESRLVVSEGWGERKMGSDC
jgi:hypothetical protein